MSVPRLLAASAVAMVLTHWLRLLPLGYAAPGATRWEDFVDLLTPYVVAGPALAVLARTGAGRRAWVAGAPRRGDVHLRPGLHLSANSISYASGPADPAYLWDEQVGHHLWFAGLTLLLVVVVHAGRRRCRSRRDRRPRRWRRWSGSPGRPTSSRAARSRSGQRSRPA